MKLTASALDQIALAVARGWRQNEFSRRDGYSVACPKCGVLNQPSETSCHGCGWKDSGITGAAVKPEHADLAKAAEGAGFELVPKTAPSLAELGVAPAMLAIAVPVGMVPEDFVRQSLDFLIALSGREHIALERLIAEAFERAKVQR